MKELLENKNGITLIALVITIIVLLILAGVSIATLTGENGILTQAEDAKKKTTKAELIERIRLEVLSSYGLDGKLDINKLNENLKKINGLTYNGKELSDSNKIAKLPAIVGEDIQIKENGEAEELPKTIVKIIANPTEYYGKKVTNYKNDGNTYRIFYVDKENYFGDGAYTIYLKADDSCAYNNKYYNFSESYDSVNTKVREMNQEWAKGKITETDTKTRGESEAAWNKNEKVAAYLCSPVNEKTYSSEIKLPWKDYYNSEYANYVIGGPSIEMYVKSYNDAYRGKINDDTKYPIAATYTATTVPGYIYKIVYDTFWTASDIIDYKDYNSMYCGKKENEPVKKGEWWLSSPSGNSSDSICVVYGGSASFGFSYSYASRGISPLVCLKSSFIPEVEEEK